MTKKRFRYVLTRRTRYMLILGSMMVVVVSLRVLLLQKVTFIVFPEMLLYPWLIAKGLALYDTATVAYPPLGILILKTIYQSIGFSIESMKAITYAVLLGSDIGIVLLVYALWRRYWVCLAVAMFFIIWGMGLESNTL